MSMNQLDQNPSQAWIWEPTIMDSHHRLYYYHHQGGQTQEANHGKEHMFEKPLTPSDVGKLNRLVIPKQHAEKYFPLDSESGEKGLLLDFEDESGKPWRFRYSYWTSSQSYVLTKGWSRFVKDKKLDAGDIVRFERYRPGGGDDRLYIRCRRRGSDDVAAAQATACRTTTGMPSPYLYMNSINGGEQAGSVATKIATGSTKRLRLFGVNMECYSDQPEPSFQTFLHG